MSEWTPSEEFYEWWNQQCIDAPGLSDACKWSAWNAWLYRETELAAARAEAQQATDAYMALRELIKLIAH